MYTAAKLISERQRTSVLQTMPVRRAASVMQGVTLSVGFSKWIIDRYAKTLNYQFEPAALVLLSLLQEQEQGREQKKKVYHITWNMISYLFETRHEGTASAQKRQVEQQVRQQLRNMEKEQGEEYERLREYFRSYQNGLKPSREQIQQSAVSRQYAEAVVQSWAEPKAVITPQSMNVSFFQNLNHLYRENRLPDYKEIFRKANQRGLEKYYLTVHMQAFLDEPDEVKREQMAGDLLRDFDVSLVADYLENAEEEQAGLFLTAVHRLNGKPEKTVHKVQTHEPEEKASGAADIRGEADEGQGKTAGETERKLSGQLSYENHEKIEKLFSRYQEENEKGQSSEESREIAKRYRAAYQSIHEILNHSDEVSRNTLVERVEEFKENFYQQAGEMIHRQETEEKPEEELFSRKELKLLLEEHQKRQEASEDQVDRWMREQGKRLFEKYAGNRPGAREENAETGLGQVSEQPAEGRIENSSEEVTKRLTERQLEILPGKVTEGLTERQLENLSGKVTEGLTERQLEDLSGKVTEGLTERQLEDLSGKVTEGLTEGQLENLSGKVTDRLMESQSESQSGSRKGKISGSQPEYLRTAAEAEKQELVLFLQNKLELYAYTQLAKAFEKEKLPYLQLEMLKEVQEAGKDLKFIGETLYSSDVQEKKGVSKQFELGVEPPDGDRERLAGHPQAALLQAGNAGSSENQFTEENAFLRFLRGESLEPLFDAAALPERKLLYLSLVHGADQLIVREQLREKPEVWKEILEFKEKITKDGDYPKMIQGDWRFLNQTKRKEELAQAYASLSTEGRKLVEQGAREEIQNARFKVLPEQSEHVENLPLKILPDQIIPVREILSERMENISIVHRELSGEKDRQSFSTSVQGSQEKTGSTGNASGFSAFERNQGQILADREIRASIERMKEELLKEEFLKEEFLKEEFLKEEFLKEEFLKEELLKEELQKEEIQKEKIQKEGILREEIQKEGILKEEILKERLPGEEGGTKRSKRPVVEETQAGYAAELSELIHKRETVEDGRQGKLSFAQEVMVPGDSGLEQYFSEEELRILLLPEKIRKSGKIQAEEVEKAASEAEKNLKESAVFKRELVLKETEAFTRDEALKGAAAFKTGVALKEDTALKSDEALKEDEAFKRDEVLKAVAFKRGLALKEDEAFTRDEVLKAVAFKRGLALKEDEAFKRDEALKAVVLKENAAQRETVSQDGAALPEETYDRIRKTEKEWRKKEERVPFSSRQLYEMLESVFEQQENSGIHFHDTSPRFLMQHRRYGGEENLQAELTDFLQRNRNYDRISEEKNPKEAQKQEFLQERTRLILRERQQASEEKKTQEPAQELTETIRRIQELDMNLVEYRERLGEKEEQFAELEQKLNEQQKALRLLKEKKESKELEVESEEQAREMFDKFKNTLVLEQMRNGNL